MAENVAIVVAVIFKMVSEEPGRDLWWHDTQNGWVKVYPQLKFWCCWFLSLHAFVEYH